MDLEELACVIIANSGDCRSCCLSALSSWKSDDLEDARAQLQQADAALISAHDAHTKVLTMEASGQEVPLTFLLAHAADHLAAAEVIRDMAEVLIN